jgi:hypothetical protein
LLGTGFLRRFVVTFDYSHQQLWLVDAEGATGAGRNRTRDMTLGDIQDAFGRAGVTCTVQIERGTHVNKVTLQLRRRL